MASQRLHVASSLIGGSRHATLPLARGGRSRLNAWYVGRLMRYSLLLLLSLLCVSCSSLRTNTCCIAANSLPEFRTAEIVGASSSLHGRPIEDSRILRDRLRRAFQSAFPNVRFVEAGGDIQLIFVLVDYVPGCLPNCGRFPTYRHWSGEVMTWVPKQGTNLVSGTQVLAVEGSSCNPFHDPIKGFVATFKTYWLSSRTPSN